jgi:hypothetical protein
MKWLLPFLALTAAAYIREDFWDACLAIATAAHWQRVALVGLVLLGWCGVTLVVLGGAVFAWGAWDCWMHRGAR